MNTYEGMFLMDTRGMKNGTEEAVEAVKGLLGKVGAKEKITGKWEERRLAYPIKRQKRGLYVLSYFECPAEAIGTIQRECHLSETVIRNLVLRYEQEVPTEIKPAPVRTREDSSSRRDSRRDPAAMEVPPEAGVGGIVDWEEE